MTHQRGVPAGKDARGREISRACEPVRPTGGVAARASHAVAASRFERRGGGSHRRRAPATRRQPGRPEDSSCGDAIARNMDITVRHHALTAVVAGWTKCGTLGHFSNDEATPDGCCRPSLGGAVRFRRAAELFQLDAAQAARAAAPAATGGTTTGAGGSRGGSHRHGGAATRRRGRRPAGEPAAPRRPGELPARRSPARRARARRAGPAAAREIKLPAGAAAARRGNGGNPGSAGAAGGDGVTAHLDDLEAVVPADAVRHLAPLRDSLLHGVVGAGEPAHRRLQPGQHAQPAAVGAGGEVGRREVRRADDAPPRRVRAVAQQGEQLQRRSHDLVHAARRPGRPERQGRRRPAVRERLPRRGTDAGLLLLDLGLHAPGQRRASRRRWCSTSRPS